MSRFERIQAMVHTLAQGRGYDFDDVAVTRLVKTAELIVDELDKIDPRCKHTDVDSSGLGPARCRRCGEIVRYPR